MFLNKTNKKNVKRDWFDFTPELPKKHAMASYCGLDFSPPLCISLEIAARGDDSEAEEPALPQGGKVNGWVWK